MSKTTLRLIIILVVLWGAAYIYKGPIQDKESEKNTPSNFLTEIDTEAITSIRVERDGVTTTLNKEDDKFKVNGTKNFYVSEETSKKILEGLEDAKKAALELVSSEEDKKEEFGTGDKGIVVQISEEGKDPVDLVVGKLANNFLDTYISLPHIPDTYSIGENLVKLFDKDDWKDKTIFNDEINKITKLRLQYPDVQLILEKDGGNWVLTEPEQFQINGDLIEDALITMTDLKAKKIPAQTFDGTGLEKHLIIAQISGEGIDNTIMIGNEFKKTTTTDSNPFSQIEDNNQPLYYAKRGDSDNIYLISKDSKDSLTKAINDLRL